METKKERKKVYLSNGEEVELLTQYQDGNRTGYVVKVVIGENNYEDESIKLICKNQIVSSIYGGYEDIPKFLYKTELESRVGELSKNIKELTEQKMKLTKELKSVYAPQHHLTKEDAEKSRQQYLKSKKIENRKRIEDNFLKAKEEFEALTP